MEKTTWETIIAVVIGILIGVFAASAFWLIKTNRISFPSQNSQNIVNTTKSTPTPTKTSAPFSLDISAPENMSIFSEKEITLKAKTLPFANMILTVNGVTSVSKADDNGTIAEKVTLQEGVNEILVSSLKDTNQVISKSLIVIYEKK